MLRPDLGRPATPGARQRFVSTRAAPDAAGLYRSEVFPGLWLDAAAILRGEPEDIAALSGAAREKGGLAFAMAGASRLLRDARQQIDALASNKYHEGLLGICTALERMVNQFCA